MMKSHLSAQNVLVLQVVMTFWLIGWFIKAVFLGPYLLDVAFDVTAGHAMFPVIFQDPRVSAFLYVLPALSLPSLISPTQGRLLFAAIIMILSSLGLMLHLNTYNDATFVTSFWVAIWIFGLGTQLKRKSEVLGLQARLLARLIVGCVFFAGFIGKLTPEYFSGEAFYNIFWVRNDIQPHAWLIEQYSADQLKQLSIYVSHAIIVIEFLLACLPIFPWRWIYIVAPVVMAGFVITNTWAILSVLSCMMGLLWGCLLFDRSRTAGGRYA